MEECPVALSREKIAGHSQARVFSLTAAGVLPTEESCLHGACARCVSPAERLSVAGAGSTGVEAQTSLTRFAADTTLAPWISCPMSSVPSIGESVPAPDGEEGWELLTGGTVSNVRRKGDVVRRPRNPQSEAILQVLEWLGERDVPCVPQIIGRTDEYVDLRYIEGTTVLRPWPAEVKTDAWLTQLGNWLAAYHQAIEGFRLRDGARFIWGPDEPAPGMVVCHGDLGPWNFVQISGKLTGVIDWDLAYFGPALDNIAHMATEVVPLREPLETNMGRDISHSQRMARLEVLLDACGGVHPAEMLQHALKWFERLIEQTDDCARRGVAPFDDFVKRGYLEEYAADARYIEKVWIEHQDRQGEPRV